MNPPTRHDPSWPYEDVEAWDEPSTDPRWECPAAFCTCHPDQATSTPPQTFSVLLCDELSARMPGARCRVLAGGILLNEDQPNADGAGRLVVRARRLPESVLVEWAPAGTPLDPRYPFRKTHYVAPAREDRAEAARRRLHNLDYRDGLTLEDDIRDFQSAHRLEPTGRLEDVEMRLIAFNDDMAVGARGARGPGGSSFVDEAPEAASAPSPGGGAGPGGVVVADAAATLEVRVTAANPGHRFVKELKGLVLVPIDDGELPIAPRLRQPGLLVFRVRGGVERLRLTLTIPKQLADAKPNADTGDDAILHVNQTFRIEDADTGRPTLVPETSNVGSAHPRLRVIARPGHVEVHLDVRFLDVTEHLKALPADASIIRSFAQFLAIDTLVCDYFALEHTGGSPERWIIVIPPAVPRGEAATNVLLFFQHEYKKPSAPDKLDYKRLELYFARSPRPGTWVHLDERLWFHRYPNLGWDDQLDKSSTPVIVAFPFPHGEGFGVAQGPAKAEALLDGLLVCLAAEKRLARDAGQPTLARLGVGGWSSGVTPTLNWCARQEKIVDEAFLFDGQRAAQPRIAGLEPWFGAKPGRKLHLVGTAYTENEVNALARRLSAKGVVARPGDPMSWYATDTTGGNPVYAFALSHPSAKAAESFKRVGTPLATPPADASDFSNIFFVKGNAKLDAQKTFVEQVSLTLAWERADGKRPEGVAYFLAPLEAASLVRFMFLGNNPDPANLVRDQVRFDRIIHFLNATGDPGEPLQSAALRHPWSVLGGEARATAPDDPTLVFVGFFQLGLEESAFT